MEAFLITIDRISAGIGKVFGWTLIVLTLGVSYEVFMRKLLTAPTTWAYDFSYIMYGALLLMTGAYTLSRNGHVRGDFVYRLWAPRWQAISDLTLYVLFFVPAMLALMYSGYTFAAMSWRFSERSIFSPAGVPIYPLKTIIPIAAAFMLLQGLAEIARCIMCIRNGRWPQRLTDVEELETAIMHEQKRLQEIDEKQRAQAAGRGAGR